MKSLIVLFCAGLLLACHPKKPDAAPGELKGQITIFHAGSLSVPIQKIIEAFNQEYPNVKVLTESAGSVACARKITELNKSCDILAVSDYKVIDQMLIPLYASWNIQFATNSLVIAYTKESKYASEMDSANWYKILLKEEVIYGRADPNMDPCGYRTVLSFMLAGQHYSMPGLSDQLIAKDQKFIRPKEVDLLAILESHAIDYIVIYRSVAVQHNLMFTELPGQMNLGNPVFSSLYAGVCTQITGNKPGETRQVCGESIVYGVTIPNNAENRELALCFIKFMLTPEKGLKIVEQTGQPPIIPLVTEQPDSIPADLKTIFQNENIQ